MEPELKILADGVEVPLVPFVEKIVGDTVAALVGSLKGTEGTKEITITLRRAKDR